MNAFSDFLTPTPAELRLEHALAGASGRDVHRLFAATCASSAAPANPATAALLAAALAADAQPGHARQAREDASGAACGATISGLKRSIPGAAGFLSAHAAAGEGSLGAAITAARFARMAVVWQGADRDAVAHEQIRLLELLGDDSAESAGPDG